jgi:hypothetical protein
MPAAVGYDPYPGIAAEIGAIRIPHVLKIR